jgi:hypothetical protein
MDAKHRPGRSKVDDRLVEIRMVRIICDSVLKNRVLKELHTLGATGFTVWPAYGEGTVVEVGWPEAFSLPNRIYVEVWCKPAVAAKIVEYCHGTMFEEIGMIAGVQPLWIHPDKAANLHDE